MCYNVAGLAYHQYKYALRMGADEKTLTSLRDKYDELRKTYDIPEHFANGFAMPNLPAHTTVHKIEPIAMRWRFVPNYVKNNSDLTQFIRRYTTLNVQAEGMWTSPMFKEAAYNQRCIIPVGGYFEYYHLNKKKYPYFITAKSKEALLLAGICNQWTNEDTGETIDTLSIVTTSPNESMRRIHNNPSAKSGPRMPLIIKEGDEDLWLSEIKNEHDLNEVKKVIRSFPDAALSYTTVAPLVGKNGSGNTAKAKEEYLYEELT